MSNVQIIKNIFIPYLSNSEFKNSRDFYNLWYKEFKKKFNLNANFYNNIYSDLPIDILIPAIDKDLDVLPFVIKSARINIKHPVDKIFIISPASSKIKDFCSKNKCVFIDEASVLGYDKSAINYNYIQKNQSSTVNDQLSTINGQLTIDRSGWLFQQLIKLNADAISDKSHFLILDADTIFIRPKKFEHKGKILLDFSDEFHEPYFKTYEKLTGLKHTYPVSFVSHYMLFEKTKQIELRKHLEKFNNKRWDLAIIDNIDNNEQSFFSEYETYSNFVLSNSRKHYMLNYWFNKSMKKEDLLRIEDLILLYQEDFISLSFHSYNL